MAQFKFLNIFKKFCFKFALIIQLFLLISQNSYAVYEGSRGDLSYSGNNMCDMGSIPYDPFVTNKDFEWDFSNATCAAFTAGAGATILSLQLASYIACRPSLAYGYHEAYEKAIEASLMASPILSPLSVAVIGHLAGQCAKRSAEYSSLQAAAVTACAGPQAGTPACATAQSNATLGATVMGVCCSAMGTHFAAVGVGLGILAVTWELADNAFQKDRICGHNWNEWHKDENGDWINRKGKRAQCISDLFIKDFSSSSPPPNCNGFEVNGTEIGSKGEHYERDVKNRFFREFIYGGIEYEDKGEGACKNPRKFSSGSKDRKDVLGYDGDHQRYYMTGPGKTPSFACRRFVDANPDSETEKAYQCCKKRSQNVICLEGKPFETAFEGYDYEYNFCEIGQRCEVGGIFYDVYESKSVSNYVCAKTYSVCPYNHLFAGGTEVRELKEDSSGNLVTKNFCQYLNHCQKLPITPYVRNSTIEGDFISQTCKDMKGDSQNVYSYNLHIAGIRMDGFTAPMAQCVKETMENVFLNKAGHSVCADPDEAPNREGICRSGYKLQKGAELPTKSFFVKIQESLRDYVKLLLIFAVLSFGVGILIAAPNQAISQKKILPFIVKIALVLYFAIGTAWKDNFVDGALQTSTMLSDMVFSVDESSQENKLDGCQFPRFDYSDDNEKTRYDEPQYAPQHKYLRIWDTLDCKIARALGYGPDVSVPNLIFMILGGFLVGGLGVIFFLATFFLAFLMISIAVRALQIFLISTTAIILLIYISPLIIPLCLFEKTKNIFTNWWKQLVGFTLQPMILFVYLGILISIIDVTIVGDVKFEGDGKSAPKKIICDTKANNNSIYCIFNIAEIQSFTGLEPIGVGLPLLASMNQQKMQYIIQSAIVLFIFFQFLDQIMVFAKKLVGGGQIKSSWDVKGLANKTYKALDGIRERGTRGIGKHGGAAMRTGFNVAKDTAQLAGQKDRGKTQDRSDSAATASDQTGSGSSDQGGKSADSTDSNKSGQGSDNAAKDGNKSKTDESGANAANDSSAKPNADSTANK